MKAMSITCTTESTKFQYNTCTCTTGSSNVFHQTQIQFSQFFFHKFPYIFSEGNNLNILTTSKFKNFWLRVNLLSNTSSFLRDLYSPMDMLNLILSNICFVISFATVFLKVLYYILSNSVPFKITNFLMNSLLALTQIEKPSIPK